MSQTGQYIGDAAAGPLTTLTGTSGGAVPSTGGNINILGTGSVVVTGDAATSTLTISGAGGIGTLNADAGSATGATVAINGTANQITTAGAAATLTLSIPTNPSLPGLVTAATGFKATTGNITATTGNFVATAGNFTATAGNFVATAGNILVSAGTVTITPLSTAGIVVNDATGLLSSVAVLPLAKGGTNATSFATTDGVVYYDGTRLVTTSAGTAGQVLTSNGAGVAPTYQAAAGGTVTFHTGSGDATQAAGAITIAGTANQITTSGAGSTVTLAIPSSPSLGGTVTAATGFTATTGNITASTGNVVVTAGNVTITPLSTAGIVTNNASGVLSSVAVVPIASGGTNATSMTNTNGAVYYDGTRLVTTTVGTSGYILTSNGAGVAPTFQAASGGGIGTLNGSTGSATGPTVTIAGTVNQITTAGAGSTITVSLPASVTITTALTVSGLSASGMVLNSAAGLLSTAATTNHALQLGNASGQLTSLALGTTGQFLQATSAGDPVWSTATFPSTAAQGDLFYGSATNVISALAKNTTATRYLSNTGASNSPAWAQIDVTNGVTGILPIANGGTNASSFGTTDGVVYYDGTRLVTTSAGTSGYVLTSNGPGVAPTYQVGGAGGGIGTLNGGTGSATGATVTIAGTANQITTTGAGSTLTISVPSSPSFAGTVTAATGFTATTGNVTITALSTAGIVTNNSSGVLSSVTTVPIANGGTNATSFATTDGVVYYDGISLVTTSAGTSGQVLTSNGPGVAPTYQAGGGGGGGMTWTEVTGTSQSMAVDNGYILNNASLVTATLPAVAAVGNVVAVAGSGAGGWKIAQNASQLINFGNQVTTTGTGGNLASTNRYDCLEAICIVANTTWVVRSSVGNITIV